MRLLFVFALACSQPSVSRDSATQLNADRRFAHDTSGNIIFGPNEVDQRVNGQIDAAGNVHATTDRWFLGRADELSQAQLALAQLAQQRAVSPDARRLADRMVVEHQALDRRLRSLTPRYAAVLPTHLAPGEMASWRRLSQLSGEDFDRTYVTAAMALDREQIELWNDELRASTDREMAQFAFDTLPRLRTSHAEAAAASTRL
jgi:putative membrane protein